MSTLTGTHLPLTRKNTWRSSCWFITSRTRAMFDAYTHVVVLSIVHCTVDVAEGFATAASIQEAPQATAMTADLVEARTGRNWQEAK